MGMLFLISFIAILAAILKLYAPKIRGARGESKIARILMKLDDSKYKVFNDLLIRTSRGTSQIDHVVVSTHGVFVVETKNYYGWIHGSEKSEYWTQSIFRNKYQFRNPIKQNWAHIFGLKETLSDFGRIPFHPIVVFTRRSELRNVYTETPVIYPNQLLRIIAKSKENEILTREQILAIERKIHEANISDRKLRKEHVYAVQNRTRHREKMEQRLVCPKCGGALVIRKGKYGKFYGCSNYPQCHHTLKY